MAGECLSFGSLKTEEKMNASAGSEHDFGRATLSVNSGSRYPIGCQNEVVGPWPIQNESRKFIASGRVLAPVGENASFQNIESSLLFGVVMTRFLLESLILAQDERWRRA